MFKVIYSDSRRAPRSAPTYEEAVEHLRLEGCAEVGHSGDLSDGGERTLAWRTAGDAENDDGAKAFAQIRRVTK